MHARLLSISIDGFDDLCCIYIVSLGCRQAGIEKKKKKKKRERERERERERGRGCYHWCGVSLV